MPEPRIIFIPGILTSPELQKFQWGKAAREMFPDREVIVMEKTYVFTQHGAIQSIRDQVLEILADGQPTVLIGHSYGGIIAVAVYWLAKNAGLTNITKLITVVSPHTLEAPGLQESRDAVGYSLQDIKDIPMYTFGARFDHLVPNKFTHYPGARHSNLLSSHSGVWLTPRAWRFRHVWNALR